MFVEGDVERDTEEFEELNEMLKKVENLNVILKKCKDLKRRCLVGRCKTIIVIIINKKIW